MIQGAGGTRGGLGMFLIGSVMTIGGIYLLFSSIIVTSRWGGAGLYSLGGFNVTTGMILIPTIFGIGMIFYDSKNKIGWVLTVGSLIAMVFGVISSLELRLRNMSVLDLLIILVLSVGGIGLVLRSLKEMPQDTIKESVGPGSTPEAKQP